MGEYRKWCGANEENEKSHTLTFSFRFLLPLQDNSPLKNVRPWIPCTNDLAVVILFKFWIDFRGKRPSHFLFHPPFLFCSMGTFRSFMKVSFRWGIIVLMLCLNYLANPAKFLASILLSVLITRRVLVFDKSFYEDVPSGSISLILKGSKFYYDVTNNSIITTILGFFYPWGRSILSR